MIVSFLTALQLLLLGVEAMANFQSEPQQQQQPYDLNTLGELLQEVQMNYGTDNHQQDRLLQSDRPCNEEIYRVPAIEIRGMLDLFVGALIQDPGQAALAGQFLEEAGKYGVSAVKVCKSCADITQEDVGSAEGFNNDSEYGFQTYCADDVYGAKATFSSLAFFPIDPETDEIFTGTLRAFMGGHSTEINLSGAPTELWPQGSLAAAVDSTTIPFEQKIYMFRNVLAPLLAASSGAAGIMPDYIGFGASQEYNRAFLMKVPYMQAYSLGFLAARIFLKAVSGGCTYLGNFATLTGWSEGGYSSAVGALTLDALGVEILSVHSGGGPLNIDMGTGYLIRQASTLPPQDLTPSQRALVSYVAYTYSSDEFNYLPNAGVDPDVLVDAWTDETNPDTNVPSWFEADTALTYQEIVPLTPVNLLDLLDPDFVAMYDSGMTLEGCANGPAPGWELVCQAFEENSVATDLQEVDSFPVYFCYSPDDEIVSFEQLFDTSAAYSPVLPTLAAQGDHNTAQLFCVLDPVVRVAIPPTPELNPALIDRTAVGTCGEDNGGSSPDGDGDGDGDGSDPAAQVAVLAGLSLFAATFIASLLL